MIQKAVIHLLVQRVILSGCIFFIIAFVSCKTTMRTTPSISTASLTNTYWKLSMIKSEHVKTPENSREVHIKFVESGKRFLGFAGCNALGGNFALTGSNGIKIDPISTKMFCDRMETENFLTEALTRANRYLVEGEKLFLFDGKKLLVSFDSVYF